MRSTDHQVIIAGAGPTGLMLAAELRLAGIDIAVIERRPTRDLVGSRAGGLHARSLEILDQRGIVGRFLAEGQLAQTTGFAGVRFDLTGLPTRHPYGLGLWQNHIERLLADRADELAVPVRRGVDLTGFTENASGIEVALSSGETLRGAFLVGCDGGRSLVRKLASIGFPGSDPTTSAIIGEMEMTETPEFGVHRGPFGIYSFGREKYEMVDGRPVFAKEGPVRVLLTEPHPGATGEPSFDELRAALIATCGTDYGAHFPAWLSRFTDASRQAEAYRKGRVLLAGDAAHIHAPDGGQGLNTGLQDAVNLGWKLALVAKGLAPESLLDTYHAERHPIGARVLRLTMAAVGLRREDDRTTALRDTMAELLGFEAPRAHLAAVLSGLEIRYDLGPGHPLLGRRMPDRDLQTAQGTRTVCSLLHEARPVLIDFGTLGGLDIAPWADRVPSIIASSPGPWELPALGPIAAPAAVLVRPDGYVAWVGEGGDTGLVDALTTWFGPRTD